MGQRAVGVAHGSVCVCVPTYNEAENIERLLGALLAVFETRGIDGRVLVIDDASPDGTGEIAVRLAARDERVHVLHQTGKGGIGRAYRAGFRWALQQGFDFVVQMDCDLSHDPAALPQLLQATRAADLVLGSRYVAGGQVRGWSPWRRLVSHGGCWYARTLLDLPQRDLTGGFKCFRRRALDVIPFESTGAQGYGFQIETTHMAVRAGLRVVETPIVFSERTAGRSKMSLAIVLEAAGLVYRLRRTARAASLSLARAGATAADGGPR